MDFMLYKINYYYEIIIIIACVFWMRHYKPFYLVSKPGEVKYPIGTLTTHDFISLDNHFPIGTLTTHDFISLDNHFPIGTLTTHDFISLDNHLLMYCTFLFLSFTTIMIFSFSLYL